MKTLHQSIWLLVAVALFNLSCRRDDTRSRVPLVSYFIFTGMTTYYLWDDHLVGKAPTEADTNAWEYFESLLHPDDHWSWLTNNVDGLLGLFAGEETSAFGFNPLVDALGGRIVGAVRYVYSDTPAEEAGIKRGDIIAAINGNPITSSNFHLLFGAAARTTFTVYDQHFENPRQVGITPRDFFANPVLYTNIHKIDGRVIGYIFYTGFRSGRDNRFIHSLFNAFSEFRQRNVTDLIVDLRYNPGGELSTAAYLASLIVPIENVTNRAVLTTVHYNQMLNDIFGVESRNTRLGLPANHSQLPANIQLPNPQNANLNLNTVHIIATESSASASELLIFCLRSFMTVQHIGEETVGKYTASITVHAFDDFDERAVPIWQATSLTMAQRNHLRNWAIQPIVAKYTDKHGDTFATEGTLIPTHPVASQGFAPDTWLPIGDLNDAMIAEAISIITGQLRTSAVRNVSGKRFAGSPLLSPQETLLRRGVLLDNMEIVPEALQKMFPFWEE